MNTLKNIITRNETYVKYRLPFTTDRYLIRWHPKSGTDIHKHNGKKCDYIMIWVLYKKLDLIVII